MSPIYTLAVLFLFTAILYSSVGFGGGSTYTALLVLSGASYALIPILSLSCNIIVVAGNVLIAQTAANDRPRHARSTPIAMATGGVLGFLSGLVGIGGGIFLAPVLHILNWTSARKIAAICSLFILVNSVAGLLGQLTKFETAAGFATLLKFWPLWLAVFLGGLIGRRVSFSFLSEAMIKRLTACLILFVSLRLGLSVLN